MHAAARLVLAAGLLWGTGAAAQEQSIEDKLREALRRSTVDLRALQDQQGQLQADRDSAVKQRDMLQQQLTEAQAKIAELQAAPKAPPVDQDELKKLSDALDAAKQERNALLASVAKWQAAYRQAAALAQAKDAEAKRLDQALGVERKVTAADLEANRKLAAVAKDILHLYETQDFRALLVKSYEPLLGMWQVKLDNLVQDYDDRIYNLRLFAPRP